MYRIDIKRSLFSIMAIGALATVSALATPIGVANASFETLPGGGLTGVCTGALLGCSYSSGVAIPGWSDTGNSGQFRPGTNAGNFTFFSTLSNGITSAYSSGGTIFQTVAPTVQLGVIYTLQVDLGDRNDLPFNSTANLLINGNVVSALGAAPTSGNWSTFTAIYTGLAADVGQAITIQLNAAGTQGNFDNVRLADNTVGGLVPEPATATVFGLGIAGILLYARRQRKS